MIEFSNVGLRYGNGPEILRDLTFSVEPGSFHFLTGPSGSGKTSLLRLLLLSLKPSRGRANTAPMSPSCSNGSAWASA